MACTNRTWLRTLDLDPARFTCTGTGTVSISDSGDFVLNDITVLGNVATISGTHTNSDGTATNFSKTLTIPSDVVTSISGNAVAGTITYVDELGASTVLDVCSIIDSCDEGAFTYNALTGSLTHTSSNGTATTVALPVTSISVNATTNEISFVDELGNTTAINLDEKGDLSYNPATSTLTHTNSIDGTTQDVVISLADGFVDSVTYNEPTQELTISWNTDAGLSDTVISLASLVDVYSVTSLNTSCINTSVTGTGSAGDPWVVSATPVVSPDADNVLECTANGLKVDYCDAFEALELLPLDCSNLPAA